MGGEDGTGGAAQHVRGNYKSFKRINLTALKIIHQFIMSEYGTGKSICAWRQNFFNGIYLTVFEECTSLACSTRYPVVSRTTSEESAECSREWEGAGGGEERGEGSERVFVYKRLCRIYVGV